MADTKKLYTRRKRLKEQIQAISDEKYALTKEEKLKYKELNRIDKKLEQAKRGELSITEHAMLRYMEHIKHLSIKELKELVVPLETKLLIKRFGSGKFPAGGTHKVIVKNNMVLTIIPNK